MLNTKNINFAELFDFLMEHPVKDDKDVMHNSIIYKDGTIVFLPIKESYKKFIKESDGCVLCKGPRIQFYTEKQIENDEIFNSRLIDEFVRTVKLINLPINH